MSEKRDLKDTMRRAAFLLIAITFVVTALGVGVLAFWQATHPQDSQSDTTDTSKAQLQGTKLTSFTPLDKVDKLQAIDTKQGTGTAATASSTVTVHYIGAVASTGVIFQSSLDSGQPIAFKLSEVIQGWAEGVPGMKAGGERRLLIPAALAYGANPPPGSGIPANADLVFDIILLEAK